MQLTRGDTAKFKFKRINAAGNVIGTPADAIYFTVKENGYTDEILIQKTLNDIEFDGIYYHLTILPEDTNELKYGTYHYDIEIIQDGVKTTVAFDEFIIAEEITFATD